MAGEFNWLSTRTRADLGYWTSLISSAATKHGAWSIELGKKVLRYLLGKQNVRIRFPRGGCSETLIAWSDAGYGGISTRSQSGIIVSWAGSVVLWRSSKQRTAAQSTCEAEVSAAALGFQIVEGLRAILEEWGVTLSTPLLLVDNKSALVLATCGGSWRTRYFAVRAARISLRTRDPVTPVRQTSPRKSEPGRRKLLCVVSTPPWAPSEESLTLPRVTTSILSWRASRGAERCETFGEPGM